MSVHFTLPTIIRKTTQILEMTDFMQMIEGPELKLFPCKEILSSSPVSHFDMLISNSL